MKQQDWYQKYQSFFILKTLFLSDDVESYSSGFKSVFHECEEKNIKTEYIIANDGFTFIFKRNVVNSVVNNVVNRPLSSEEKIILDLLKNDPYLSAEKISKLLNKSSRSIQRCLANLRDDGFIRRIGLTKGYWEVIE